MSLRVLVIGAGIGGLTTALALRKQGHTVVIFEKSRFAEETGAAIHIAPNCTRLLQRFGLEPLDHGATVCEAFTQYDPYGEVPKTMNIWQDQPESEKDWYFIHRAHLHRALKDLATTENGDGQPAKLMLACKLININPDAGEVELSTGEKYIGDVVIGADGVHSWTRAYVNPNARPFLAGKSCFRWLNPHGLLESEDLTKGYSKLKGHLIEWSAFDRRLIHYPCAGHTVSNFVGFVPMNEAPDVSTEWNGGGGKSALIKAFKTFGPGPRKILEQVPEDDLKLWALLDMTPLDTWFEGRLAPLGDAAHPFMPYMSQGGAMSIEDAAALAAILCPGTVSNEIPRKLEIYQKCRQERANRIQDFTRKNGRDMGNVDLPRPSGKSKSVQSGLLESIMFAAQELMGFVAYCNDFDQWEVACQGSGR